MARAYAIAIDARTAALGSSPTGDCRLFTLDETRLHATLREADVADSGFEMAVRELQDALTAAAVGVPKKQFVEAVSSRDEEGGSPAELERKYELVGELFELKALRQRAWAKFTSKTPNFGRLDWEVVQKRSDDDVPRPDGEPAPVAQVELQAWGPESGAAAHSQRMLFAMDRVDVQVVIRGLERLRDSLDEMEGEDG